MIPGRCVEFWSGQTSTPKRKRLRAWCQILCYAGTACGSCSQMDAPSSWTRTFKRALPTCGRPTGRSLLTPHCLRSARGALTSHIGIDPTEENKPTDEREPEGREHQSIVSHLSSSETTLRTEFIPPRR